jgi:hypothetical protein
MEGEVQASANEQVAEHKSNVALRFQFNNGLIRGFTCGLEDEVNEVVIKFIGTFGLWKRDLEMLWNQVSNLMPYLYCL